MEEPRRPKVLLFGGTSEGRELAEWLSERGTCDVVASSLTEYGGSLVRDLPCVESLTGAMLPDRMRALMDQRGFDCVVDATHPYAAGVSASIASCADACGVRLVRVVREGAPEGPWISVPDARACAALVAELEGNVLLTTGSKDLPLYVDAVADYADRLYARILPVASSITAASELGIPTSHVIAMQGPFSKELNCAIIREFDIRVLVTKASGSAGGFWEKAEAARECGIELVVIDRPSAEEGLALSDARRLLADEFGI